jgi:hypothetical protein
MDPRLAEALVQERSLGRRQDILDAQRRILAGERPWEQARGVAAVLAAVLDFRFPTTADELAGAVGWRKVDVGDGHRVSLRSILEALAPDQSFLSLADFQAAVERNWQRIRTLP